MDEHLSDQSGPSAEVTQHPEFSAALRFWIKLGFISFGGPAWQIAIVHREWSKNDAGSATLISSTP